VAGVNREAVVSAFMALLAEKGFSEIDLTAVAARADVSLADLRGEFGSTFDMLAAFYRDIDKQVLAGNDPEMAGSPGRERLFDVLMRRIETAKPHKAALRSLAQSAQRDPSLAWGLNKLSLRSQQWMLAAAGIESSGMTGRLRAQGLVLVMARTLRVWFEDDDEGLARTMAALDRKLRDGEALMKRLETPIALCSGFARVFRSLREDRTSSKAQAHDTAD
jgi:AcrR family transcriptional regulator